MKNISRRKVLGNRWDKRIRGQDLWVGWEWQEGKLPSTEQRCLHWCWPLLPSDHSHLWEWAGHAHVGPAAGKKFLEI